MASATAEGLLTAVRGEEARLAAVAAEHPTHTVITGEGEPQDEHEFAVRERLEAPIIGGKQRYTRGGQIVG